MAVETRTEYGGGATAPVAALAPTVGSGPRRRAGGRTAAGALLGFVPPVVLLAIWELASVSGWVKPYLLPPPTAVVGAIVEMARSGQLARDLQASALRWLAGFVIGGGLGLVLGSWVGLSRGAERLLDTSVQMLRTVPFLALTPLLVIWLGLDEAPKIALVALASFFPLYINTFAGIRDVDRKLVEVGRVYQLSTPAMLRRVIIPAALPSVFTGVRYGLGVAWLALVIAELMGATRGLGYMLIEGRESVRIEVIVAGILLFSIVGKVVDTVVRLLERRFLRWRDTYAGG